MRETNLKNDFLVNPFDIIDSRQADFKKRNFYWTKLINKAGAIANVHNPTFATREECWGNGSMKKLTENMQQKVINEGASVLNSMLCELLLHWFLPNIARPSVIDVFAGGVQMGFVAGAKSCRYRGIELRQNQTDANNAIFNAAKIDSKTYAADGTGKEVVKLLGKNNDFFFTCPPYWGTETYKDYNKQIPDNELNNLSYDVYLKKLYDGITNGINCLNENRFCAIMIGESRQKNKDLGQNIELVRRCLRKNNLTLINDLIFIENVNSKRFISRGAMKNRVVTRITQHILIAYKGNVRNIQTFFNTIKIKKEDGI